MGDLFDAASIKHCSEDSCYIGTCPVNCLVTLFYEHLQVENNEFLMFCDWALAKKLAK